MFCLEVYELSDCQQCVGYHATGDQVDWTEMTERENRSFEDDPYPVNVFLRIPKEQPVDGLSTQADVDEDAQDVEESIDVDGCYWI